MEERRKFPRVSHRFELEVHPVGGEATGRDVSKGGISFTHHENVPAGTTLDLEIRVPGLSGSYKVKGRVVRTRPEGSKYVVAVNFVDVDAATESAITDMLQSFF